MKQKKAKWPWILLVFFVLIIGVFAGRHFLIATVLERSLSYISHEKLLYKHRQIQGKGIQYEYVSLGEGIAAQHVAIDWNWQFFPFYLEPKVNIRGAYLTINPEENNTALAALLLPTKYFGVRLHIEDGEILIHGKEEPVPFSFHAGEAREDLGTLKVDDTIVAQVRQTVDGMQLLGSMQDIDLCDARDLWVRFLLIQPQGGSKMGGILRLDGQVELDHQFAIQTLKADLSIENATWERGDIACDAKHVQLALHYPSGDQGALWQQILAAAAWEEGHVRVKEALCLQTARGHLYFRPQQEPLFEMEGKLGDELCFTVDGRGVLEKGETPWIEMHVKAGDSLATVAINYTDWGVCPIKVDLENWKDGALRETIKAASYFFPHLGDVRATQGTLQGRLETKIERGTIQNIEWHDLSLHDAYFELPKMAFQGFFGEMLSSGSLKECDLHFSQGLLSYNKKRVEDFHGALKVVDGAIKPSVFTCKIEGVKTDIKIEGRWDALQFQAALEAPLGTWAALAHQTSNMEKMLHVDVSGSMQDGHLDTTGSLKTDVDLGEFGLALDKELKIEEGWFAIARATRALYGPFLKGALVDGDLSIRGKMKGSHIDGHFTFDNPSFITAEVQLAATKLDEGRFSWNGATGGCEGSFSLQEGKIEQAHFKMEGVQGEFTFTENRIESRSLSYADDGLAFLGDLELVFAKEGEWDLGVTSRMAEGDIAKILPLLSFPTDITGKFYTEKDGLQCRIQNRHGITDYLLRVAATLSDTSYGLLHEGQGLFEYDSKTELVQLSQFQAKVGDWVVKSRAATFKNLPTKPLEFDVEVVKKDHPGLKLHGIGHLPPDNHYRLELSAGSDRTLKLTFASTEIEWNLTWPAVRASGCIAGSTYFLSSLALEEVPGIIFSTPKPLVLVGSQCHDIRLVAKEGEKIVGELSAPLARIHNEGLEILKAQLTWQDFNLPLHLHLTAERALLKTGHDALKISWEKQLNCQGTLQGLLVNVTKQDQAFVGRLKIEDGAVFSAFTKKEILKEISGFELEGAWKNEPSGWHFVGKVQGKDATLKGYLVHELQGDITIHPKAVAITNLQIEDPAGQFACKQITVRKSITGSWDTDIPLVKGHHFKPSLLRSTHGKHSKEKPFEIRSLVLTDLFCSGNDIFHLRGKGSFHFTNREKKESSIFDIPLKMMKDLGLDFDLFRPESGDVKCLFREGRIYLTELDNSFSEGRRSQFFLASDLEPSYIDWQGKLHLNLRMKQDAAFKLGEPFALTVRGTADKPSYGLR